MVPIEPRTAKRRSLGAAVAVLGFVLSPLSWWNDLVVNVPLALGFAWLVSWFHPPAFGASFVVGYWLTNVLGLVLLQHGAEAALAKEMKRGGTKAFLKHVGVALLYTILIVVLIKLGALSPLPRYFQ